MDEDYDISLVVSTAMTANDLITTLSSLVCRRAITVGRAIIDTKPGSTVVLNVTLSNDNGHMEAQIWVKWNELARLIYADMLQKNSPTETTSDLVEDILNSRACRNKVEA